MKTPDNKKKILIVEDELLVAEDIAFRLKSLGYVITDLLISGEEVLPSIEKEKPDLILMDIMLKGKLDGIQTHELINRKYKIPLVYLTSYSDEKTFSRAKLTQPFGYIIKPFDERELHTVIEVAIYKHSMEMRLEHQLKNEELISRISTQLLATKTENLDTVIIDSLRIFGEYMGVDKAFILIVDQEKNTYDSVYEWCFDEKYSVSGRTKSIPLNNIMWSLEKLSDNKVLIINSMSDFPPEAGKERKLVESFGIKSYTAVGLNYNNQISGVLGFDSILFKKEWDEREIFSVKLFGEIIANTLERKQIEAQLINSEKNLRELNAAKDKFFSIIAHDLKNPFMGILGFTEILSNSFGQYDDAEKQKMISFIKRSAESAYKLVENLLEWSRIQIGVAKAEPLQTDISILINESITSLKDVVHAKNIKIITTVQNETYVYADEEMIKTIIRNLLTNAIKFSHPDGYIKITAEEQTENLKLSITDKGTGIRKDLLENLFRIDKSITTKGTLGEKGTGLGLILCKEFAEKNNGQIVVSSIEKEGSTFSVILPKEEFQK
ncbi:MAG: ATP-binding protein [Ignavibacteriae bacterium]|nr:ATP-binding protein [Ignavibacteriota bacterium]